VQSIPFFAAVEFIFALNNRGNNKEQRQLQRQRLQCNRNSKLQPATSLPHKTTTLEGEKFVWLIFRLQIKSKIALKLHAAEKLCSQQHSQGKGM